MSYNYDEEQRRKAELEARRAEVRRQDEEQKRQAAAAVPQTPRDVAKTAQPQQRPDGFVTQVGQALNYAFNDAVGDGLNAIAAGINQITPQNFGPVKSATQATDDFVKSSGELKQFEEQRANEVKENGSSFEQAAQGLNTNLEAVSTGMQAGIALPFTLAASLAGQNAPWSRSPEIVKDHPVSDTIFKITEIVLPSILTGGAFGPAAATTTALGVESFAETVAQDNVDELIAGRELAVQVGNLASYLGYDGTQLTQEMIEGKTITGKALTGSIGFLQNFGINIAADQILKRVAPIAAEKFSPVYERVARVLGTNSAEVRETISNVNTPKYSDLAEPHDVADIDSSVPVVKAQEDPVDVNALTEQWQDLNRQIDEAARNWTSTFGSFEELKKFTSGLKDQQFALQRNMPMSTLMGLTDFVTQKLDLGKDNSIAFGFRKEKFATPQYATTLDNLGTSIWDVGWESSKIGYSGKQVISTFNKWLSTMEPGTILSNAPIDDSVRGSKAAKRRVTQAEEVARGFAEEERVGKFLAQAREDWIKQNSDQFPWSAADGSQSYSTPGDYWDSLNAEDQLERAERLAVFTQGYDWYTNPPEVPLPNTRGKIYKRLGFGDVDEFHGHQYGVVRAHPDGKGRYLDPLNLSLEGDEGQLITEAVNKARNVEPSATQATSVNPVALTAEVLRPSALASDDTLMAGRHYFTNWRAVVDEEGLQTVLKEATSTLKRLRDFPTDMRESIDRVLDWWKHNSGLFETDIDTIAKSFAKNFTSPIKDGPVPDELKIAMSEYLQVEKEGFLAASLVAEELGIRIQKQARDVLNLENLNIDFMQAFENLLSLHDTANLFLIPMRRAKRRWAVEGYAQQRKTLEALKDADVRNAKSAPFPDSYHTASASDLTKVRWTDEDPGMTLREMWEGAKNGDEDSLNLLKQYVNYIAYSDPREALSNSTVLSAALKKARNKDFQEAVSTIWYAFRLSRPRTQITSLVSNLVSLVGEPIGSAWSGERSYALGQLVGGWSHLSSSLSDMGRAFKANKPLLDGHVRYGDNTLSHVERAAQIEDRHMQMVRSMNDAKSPMSEKFGEFITYKLEQLANNPLLGMPQRLLVAQDEGAKAVTAAQVATGRAFQEAQQMGLLSDKDTLKRLVDRHFNLVFSQGVQHGKIIDPEVQYIARARTFQNDIPDPLDKDFIDNGMLGNAIDAGFRGIKAGADESAIFKFFSPFTRMSYNALERGGVYLAGATTRVGGTAAMQALFPRYKAIMSGEMGDAARIQLQSSFALAELTALTGVLYAAMGGLTGVNEKDKPRQSFIVPAPGTETGYIAIPYNRIPLLSMVLTPLADAVNGFRDEILTRGDYDKFMTEMVFAMGMATVDQSFNQGLLQASELLDVKNMDPSRVNAFASTIASIPMPTVVPAVAGYFAPFFQASRDDGNNATTFMAKLGQRTIGGVGLPPIYDELTGKPQPRVAALGKTDDYWSHVGASLLNEFLWPGAVLPVDPKDKVKQKLKMVGYEIKPEDSYRTYKGVNLGLQEQSALSLAMHTQGNLRGQLETYFKSERFNNLWNKFNKLRKENPGGAQEGRSFAAKVILERDIHGDIRSIRNNSKEIAMKHLSSQGADAELLRKFTAINQLVQIGNP